MKLKEKEKEAFEILISGIKGRMKIAVDKELTCILNDYSKALYNLIQMRSNIFIIRDKK